MKITQKGLPWCWHSSFDMMINRVLETTASFPKAKIWSKLLGNSYYCMWLLRTFTSVFIKEKEKNQEALKFAEGDSGQRKWCLLDRWQRWVNDKRLNDDQRNKWKADGSVPLMLAFFWIHKGPTIWSIRTLPWRFSCALPFHHFPMPTPRSAEVLQTQMCSFSILLHCFIAHCYLTPLILNRGNSKIRSCLFNIKKAGSVQERAKAKGSLRPEWLHTLPLLE